MKKIIKNIFITFMIIYTTLNILGLVFNNVQMIKEINEEILPMVEEPVGAEIIKNDEQLYNRYKNEYGENAPTSLLIYSQGCIMGETRILEMQLAILIVSVFLGVTVGIIISLSETNKVKQIILFIVIGVGLALLGTIYSQITNGTTKFFDNFLVTFVEDYISNYWMYYTIIYLVIYIIKYFIARNKAKKLNAELKTNMMR